MIKDRGQFKSNIKKCLYKNENYSEDNSEWIFIMDR